MTAHPCHRHHGFRPRTLALGLVLASLGTVSVARAQDAPAPGGDGEPAAPAEGTSSGEAEAPPTVMPTDDLPPGLAPSEGEQAEARALFEAGRAAYNEGRLEDALGHFQRASELSDEPRLLYNVGTTADRLRRDELALEAYETFLERVPDAAESTFVRRRIAYLREHRPGDGGGEGPTGSAPGGGGEPAGRSAVHLGGSIALGAAGLAFVGVGIGSFVKGDSCAEQDPATGECHRGGDQGDSTAGALWTVAGAAALGGAVLWLVLTTPDGGGAAAASAGAPEGAGASIGLSPRSVELRVRF